MNELNVIAPAPGSVVGSESGAGPAVLDRGATPAEGGGVHLPSPGAGERPAPSVRTAFHEAGHCVAAWALGHEVKSVTVEPCENFNGLARWDWAAGRIADDWLDGLDLTAPVLAWPTAVRAVAETRVAVALAGDVAAELLLMSAPPRKPERVTGRAADDLADVDLAFGLPEEERAALAAAASGWPGSSDSEHVAEVERALHGGDVAAAAHHVAWLSAQVRAVLTRHWPAVEAVADALLDYRTLSGPHVAYLIEGTEADR